MNSEEVLPLHRFYVDLRKNVKMAVLINLLGAAGDLFVTVKFSCMPSDILIRDHGVGMTVYTRASQT